MAKQAEKPQAKKKAPTKKTYPICDVKKQAMLDALEKSLGIVTTASKSIGIERTTHYLWMRTDPDYAKKVEELSDMVLDFAESQLHKQIKEGNTTATIFYLKTKGKKRDYVERTEIKHETGIESAVIEWMPSTIEKE
jgi:hypothetical protein